jgi:hypothetical protein
MTTVTAAAHPPTERLARPARLRPRDRGGPDDPGPEGRERPDRSFLRWGAATYALVMSVLVVACLRATSGRLVYALDDPAIHLSLADNLLRHGTWGVEPGRFESASSSPLWTLLLAGWSAVSPHAELGPLVLNAAAALAVVAVLGANQTVLRPSRRRPLDALAVAVLVTVVLFLPGLTVVGMEHTLHMALVLGAVVLLHRRSEGERVRWPAWLPYVLLALATLTRVETAFVAAGLAAAELARCAPGWGPDGGTAPAGRAVRRAGLVALAAALPLALLGGWTRLMGQGWLPSSILAKSQTDDQALQHSFVRAALNRLTTDPLLVCLVLVAVGGLVLAWRQGRRFTYPAVAFVTATVLHAAFARMGWYERYQAYLVLLGVYAALQLAAATLGPQRRRERPALIPVLVLASLLFTATKVSLTADAPRAVADTYEQRFQAALFLDRYYAGQPVATGELGYVSLLHEGPVTDLFGLGDHEVLEQRRASHTPPPAGYWADLARRRGFEVVAVYPSTLGEDTPAEWTLAGEWRLTRRTVTAYEPTFQFWATTSGAIGPLQDHLRDFAPELPPGVEVHVPDRTGT